MWATFHVWGPGLCAVLVFAFNANAETCLPNGIPEQNRLYVSNATGQPSPIRFVAYNWDSARVINHVAEILVSEVLGFHVLRDPGIFFWATDGILKLAGWHLSPVSGDCEPCMEGSSCVGGGVLQLLPGYYSAKGSPGSVLRCFGDAARCPGGDPGTSSPERRFERSATTGERSDETRGEADAAFAPLKQLVLGTWDDRDLFFVPLPGKGDASQNVLNPCTIKAYQPKVQWVLESFVTRGSDAELEQDWAHASAREGVQCEDLTNPEGSDELKGLLRLSYFGLNDGSFVPSEAPPHGWHERDSDGDQRGRSAAPLLAPILGNMRQNNLVTCFTMASQQLALPCSLLALKSEGFEVLEVLSADRLHGFGLRVAFDLLLAVRSVKTLETCIVAAYFHPMMTASEFTRRVRPCRRHHCRGPTGQAGCNCIRLWIPTVAGARWSASRASPKGKAKAKSKKKSYVEAEDEEIGGLEKLRSFLSGIKTI
eukprot:g18091.t1